MYELFIKKSTFSALLFSAAILVISQADAAKKDLEEDIHIFSLRQSADLKNKVASYLDNVRITQGSISINADLIQIFKKIDDETGIETDTYVASGKPAIFKQQLEDGSSITLQADEIKYLPHLNMIKVLGNAIVKQAGSEVAANQVTYNTLTEQLDAQGNNKEGVTTILQPSILKSQKKKNENSQ
ncbi:MAG: lipopolysaccharide transport periplasmic protein LptA [Colwellia sp.]